MIGKPVLAAARDVMRLVLRRAEDLDARWSGIVSVEQTLQVKLAGTACVEIEAEDAAESVQDGIFLPTYIGAVRIAPEGVRGSVSEERIGLDTLVTFAEFQGALDEAEVIVGRVLDTLLLPRKDLEEAARIAAGAEDA